MVAEGAKMMLEATFGVIIGKRLTNSFYGIDSSVIIDYLYVIDYSHVIDYFLKRLLG